MIWVRWALSRDGCKILQDGLKKLAISRFEEFTFNLSKSLENDLVTTLYSERYAEYSGVAELIVDQEGRGTCLNLK